MAEFTINGRTYRSGKLNVLDAAHVLRRLLPVVSSMQEVRSAAESGELASIPILDALAKAVSSMTDESFDYVLNHCLKVVQRKDDGDRGWSPVWSIEAKRPLFEGEMTLSTMMQIVVQVLQDNYSDFFPVLPPA